MPLYRVQLKQGRRTITNQVEAKSVADCLAFFNELTTMKVSEILKIEYSDDTHAPIDDFNYWAVFKGIIKTNMSMSKQIVLNNVKLNKNEGDIALSCRNHLEVGGFNIESVVTGLFKKS